MPKLNVLEEFATAIALVAKGITWGEVVKLEAAKKGKVAK